MIYPEIHPAEKARLEKLKSYSILDSLPEEDYYNLTAIAAQICRTPISLVTLLDDKRQWFKSHHGLDVSETPKEYSFCGHAIKNSGDVFVIEDARKDERFHDNPLVTDDPHVIFYAGVPLITDDGLPLGTLCVIDNAPRNLDDEQLNSLKALSRQVIKLMELRKAKFTLEQSLINLEKKNEELEKFAMVAAHDIKSPLNNISQLAEVFIEDHRDKLDADGIKIIELLQSSSDKLRALVDGLLKYSRASQLLKEDLSKINLNELRERLQDLIADHKSNISIKTEIKEIATNKTALDQILVNLVTNAIKYSDKERTKIEIGISESDNHYEIYVKDDGPGIPQKYQEKIFEIFQVITPTDKFGNRGNGIGLATVKKLVEALGGRIEVTSRKGQGTQFTFTLNNPK